MKLIITPSELEKTVTIKINGYKHSMVQIIAASIILNQRTYIHNIPLVDDTFVMQNILRKIGCIFEIIDKTILIDPNNICSFNLDDEMCKKIHGSMYLFIAVGLRFGRIHYKESGGCQIGSEQDRGKRPFSHLVDVLDELGFSCAQKCDDYVFTSHKSPKTIDIKKYSDSEKQLEGALISSATKASILIGCTLNEIEILNPYLKNDVLDLLDYIAKSGYLITNSGKRLHIMKKNASKPSEIHFYLSDCVSEIISYTALSIMQNISLTLRVNNIRRIKKVLKPEISALKRMGVIYKYSHNTVVIIPPQEVKKINLKILHTTIQSDHHPFFALILTKGTGVSTITEYVWKNRFRYITELNKLGYIIKRVLNKIYIYPSQAFCRDVKVDGCDTRATALLIIAALGTQANIEIENADHITRGYENFIENLKNIGANIEVR